MPLDSATLPNAVHVERAMPPPPPPPLGPNPELVVHIFMGYTSDLTYRAKIEKYSGGNHSLIVLIVFWLFDCIEILF